MSAVKTHEVQAEVVSFDAMKSMLTIKGEKEKKTVSVEAKAVAALKDVKAGAKLTLVCGDDATGTHQSVVDVKRRGQEVCFFPLISRTGARVVDRAPRFFGCKPCQRARSAAASHADHLVAPARQCAVPPRVPWCPSGTVTSAQGTSAERSASRSRSDCS